MGLDPGNLSGACRDLEVLVKDLNGLVYSAHFFEAGGQAQNRLRARRIGFPCLREFRNRSDVLALLLKCEAQAIQRVVVLRAKAHRLAKLIEIDGMQSIEQVTQDLLYALKK